MSIERVKDLIDCHSMNTIECSIKEGVLFIRAEYLDCFYTGRVQCYEVIYGPLHDEHGVPTEEMVWKLFDDEDFISLNYNAIDCCIEVMNQIDSLTHEE